MTLIASCASGDGRVTRHSKVNVSSTSTITEMAMPFIVAGSNSHFRTAVSAYLSSSG